MPSQRGIPPTMVMQGQLQFLQIKVLLGSIAMDTWQ
jgi:hypothetical protein